jgi:hypothetical protein
MTAHLCVCAAESSRETLVARFKADLEAQASDLSSAMLIHVTS